MEAPMWPDFIAPPKHENPDPRWEDPALPDFRLIWRVARECGYAVGLHGSMRRDCDMIAVPWADEAVIAFELIERLCVALNARVVGPVAGKPHGRLGWNLQVDGYVKVIDISVMPRACDTRADLIDMDVLARVEAALMRQHAWHLSQTEPVDMGGVEIVPFEAYAEGTMCEETIDALAAIRALKSTTQT